MACVVYVIQLVEDGPVKIGSTNHLARRVSEIQVSCPSKINLVSHFPGGADLEQALHRLLREHRIRGEWFRPDAPVLEAIAKAKAGSLIPKGEEAMLVFAKRLHAAGQTYHSIAKVLGVDDRWLKSAIGVCFVNWKRPLTTARLYGKTTSLPRQRRVSGANMTGIERAIEAAGGQEALAARFRPRISQQAVAKMKKRGYASLTRAKQLHKIFPEMPVAGFLDPVLRKEMTI